MKNLGLRSALCAAALAAVAAIPAHAGVATFDDVAPNIFVDGDSIVSGGFTFNVSAGPFGSAPGFGIVDTAAAFSLFSNAPTGNATQFYGGLNDNAITMTASTPNFSLAGFEFGFVTPVPIPGATSPGALIVYWIDDVGQEGFSAFDFGDADANGDWAFLTASGAAPDFGTAPIPQWVQQATFFACVFNGASCSWPSDNQAQFALDNVRAEVPLPATPLLAGLGLLAVAVTRRRAAG